MRAADLMTKNVETVPGGMAAADAWELMRRKGIHHLVVMADSKVVGVLSARDAGGRKGTELRDRSSVADLMTSPAITVDHDTTIRRIANLMRGRTIGCVPVLKGTRLVGIVTVSDLLQLVGGGVGRAAEPPRHGLHHRVPHRKQKSSYGVW